MNEPLEQDLPAFIAQIDDPAEALLVAELLAIASSIPVEPETGQTYTPFVYPH